MQPCQEVDNRGLETLSYSSFSRGLGFRVVCNLAGKWMVGL